MSKRWPALGSLATQAQPGYASRALDDPSDVVRLNNFYITCQVDEDLPYVLKYTGEDHLLVGSDYTHADLAQEFQFPKLLQDRADREEIPQSAVQKILFDNPRAFYGL